MILKLIIKSILVASAAVALLVGIIAIPSAESGLIASFQRALYYLLLPGILLGFWIGPVRVHDLTFWIFAIVLNLPVYSFLVFGVLFIRQLIIRKRHLSDSGEKNREKETT